MLLGAGDVIFSSYVVAKYGFERCFHRFCKPDQSSVSNGFLHGRSEYGRCFSAFGWLYEMLCAIWYHLHNFKNVKNSHRGVLVFGLQLTKSIIPP